MSSAEERAANDTYNLSGAFEEQVRRVIDSLRGSMSLLKPRLAAEGANLDLVEWLAKAPEFAETTAQISYTGPDGRLLSSSLERHPEPVDLSYREHIRVHLQGKRELFIGPPVIGRVSKQVTMQVSERVETPDGKLAGVLVFSISPEFLTTLHRSVRLGKEGSMILVGEDGIIRASFAGFQKSDLEFIGRKILDSKPFTGPRSAGEGSYAGESPLDGKPAFFYWRKVAGYPLYVIVGLGQAEVLSVANRSAVMLIGLGTAVVLLTLAMSLILRREIARRVQREIALFDESLKVVHAKDRLQRRHRQLLATSEALNVERARLQRLNSELGTAKDAAEQANRAKTSLLMNMSHEFRTPMHAILNYTGMGLKRIASNDTARLKKYFTNIELSGIRLLSMLNALLDLAKLESGKFELRLARGDLAQSVRQSKTEIESLFESKQLRFEIEVLTSDTTAVFDKQRILQVFINLFSNAIKYSPTQSTVTVILEEATLPCGRPAIQCAVADRGIGVPGAELETIFDKFTQSSQSANGAGSSGLGLAICREILTLHEGRIWAANGPSGGAIFSFMMPRDLPVHQAEPAPRAYAAIGGGIPENRLN